MKPDKPELRHRHRPHTDNASVVIDEIVEEMTEQVEIGRVIDVEAFVGRLPQKAEDIRLAAASLQELAKFNSQPTEDGKTDLHRASATTRDSRRDNPLDLVGSKIGPYKIRELLGEGGFGVVYVAEQSKPIQRKVALKVIKPGMDSREVIARFEAERQALAMMDHPNVARVIDGGSTEDGRPYFVMELVPGTKITEFCDRQNLKLPQRLGLFCEVCRAIQHAHHKGIIHRDIKPSNVLVTMRDDHALAKVIDFGVAKALYQRLTEESVYTAIGQIVGTPLYMSPEQIQLNEFDVDTRSDVYALGVLLYELITGATPFGRDELDSKGLHEFRKLVCESQPPNPSHRLSTASKSDDVTLVDERHVDRSQEVKQVRGELDWIVIKALEKDRTRRYQSAQDFADDVERFLSGQTVEAYPPSMVYRAKKYTRKHRVVLGAAAIVLLSLLGGIAGTSYQAHRASKQAKTATEQAARASAAEQLASQRADELVIQRNAAQTGRQKAEANLDIAIQAVDELLAEVANSQLRDVPGALPAATAIVEDAVDFYKRLAKERPDDRALRQKAASAKVAFAEYVTDARAVGGFALYEEVIQDLETLYAEDPSDSATALELVIALSMFARENQASGRGHPMFERALKIAGEQGFDRSQDRRRVQAMLLPMTYLGFYRPNSNLTESIELLESAREIIESFNQDRSSDDLPISDWLIDATLGRRFLREEDYENGLRHLWACNKKLSKITPDALRGGASREELFSLALNSGKSFEATQEFDNQLGQSLFDNFVTAAEQLLERYPNNRRFAERAEDLVLARTMHSIKLGRLEEAHGMLTAIENVLPANVWLVSRAILAIRQGDDRSALNDLYPFTVSNW